MKTLRAVCAILFGMCVTAAYAGSTGTPPLPSIGPALQDGGWLLGLAGGQNQTVQNGITAHAGGGQTNAFQLAPNVAMFEIDTVASSGDSIALPSCVAPFNITVRNAGANALNLYASSVTNPITASTDQINGNSNSTSFSVPVGNTFDAYCIKNGVWSVAFNPSSSGNVSVANGKTLTVSNSLTFTGTDGTSFAFPSASSTVMTLANPGTLTGALVFVASAAALTPTKDTAGTLNTTAVAGGHEYDGTTFYDSVAASARGVRDVEQYQYLTTTFTLTSQQAAQQALNGTTNGAFAVAASTAYRFDCNFGLTSMSASSGSFGFAWGLLNSATLTAQYWTADGQKGGTSLATAAATNTTFNSAANTTLVTATTGTTGSFHAYGILQVNAAGSLQPQISLGVAAAAVVAAGSGCRVWPIGPAATVVVGNWN